MCLVSGAQVRTDLHTVTCGVRSLTRRTKRTPRSRLWVPGAGGSTYARALACDHTACHAASCLVVDSGADGPPARVRRDYESTMGGGNLKTYFKPDGGRASTSGNPKKQKRSDGDESLGSPAEAGPSSTVDANASVLASTAPIPPTPPLRPFADPLQHSRKRRHPLSRSLSD